MFSTLIKNGDPKILGMLRRCATERRCDDCYTSMDNHLSISWLSKVLNKIIMDNNMFIIELPFFEWTQNDIDAYYNQCVEKFDDSKNEFETQFVNTIKSAFRYGQFCLKDRESYLEKFPNIISGTRNVYSSHFVVDLSDMEDCVYNFIENNKFKLHVTKLNYKSGMIRIYLLINDCLVEVNFLTPFCNFSYSGNYPAASSRGPFDEINGFKPHSFGHEYDLEYSFFPGNCKGKPNGCEVYKQWLEETDQEEDLWAEEFFIAAFA